ncbi:MAG: DUF5590 domain-containing protein [Streptococcaceae bacterium]|jgi:uncharacterized protein YpmB|nr:DUF5590 domain-containing protein [Streptococcaceae bacterium]
MSKWKMDVTGFEKAMLIILAVVLFLFVSCTLIFLRANMPMFVAKMQATAIAKSTVGMKKVEKFYRFTRRNTYYSVQGCDSDNNEVYVIVPDSGSKVTVIKKDQGITEEKAVSLVRDSVQKVLSTNIGMYDDQLVWEVVTTSGAKKYSYYLLDFKTGKNIKELKDT